ncbi:hypothetical protein ACIQTW_20495 [Paenarthrobacter sp. NPDC090517]|uniref:hypothetical protein n=1 Tax=Paenarthrobacter sp. NPDC090517 TaxID=3364381 RepID=UPI0037FBF678
MRLTVRISKATDGRLDLYVVELPELEAQAQRVAEIPETVREAAAILTGRSKDDFDVEVGY